ncbi:MAG: hypothetical protein QOD78_949 [Chloroflexota bacterium]|nr:hypothetical protein [Chloroflexota bacterium]
MVAAAILWTAIVLIWALFVLGGQVYMCLGPLGVTEESCRAANGLPPLTDWDRFVRGWGPVAIVLIAGWASIAGIAAIPAIVRRRRQRGGL